MTCIELWTRSVGTRYRPRSACEAFLRWLSRDRLEFMAGLLGRGPPSALPFSGSETATVSGGSWKNRGQRAELPAQNRARYSSHIASLKRFQHRVHEPL